MSTVPERYIAHAASSDINLSMQLEERATSESTSILPSGSDIDGNDSSKASIENWTDCYDVLEAAAEEMTIGEMIHPRNFSLFAAMSAIELMQPKMDVGCGPTRNVHALSLPSHLSGADAVRICDELMANLATWMNAHTLPQSIFSCAYMSRPSEVPRPDLRAFLQVVLAVVALIRKIICTEDVADEEDFIAFDFGFSLPQITEPTLSRIVDEGLAETDFPDSTPASLFRNDTAQIPGAYFQALSLMEEEEIGNTLVASRLLFLQTFHALLSVLYDPFMRRFRQVRRLFKTAHGTINIILRTWSTMPDGIIPQVFDATFHQHLLANTPPRTCPVLTRPQAFENFSRQLSELHALLNLENILLPKSPALASEDTSFGLYSFQALFFGMTYFSAKWKPNVLTRSLLKRLLIPDFSDHSTILSVDGARFSSLMLGDIEASAQISDTHLKKQVMELVPYASHIMWSLCRNRGRQRRNLIKSLHCWDRAVWKLMQFARPYKRRSPSTPEVVNVEGDMPHHMPSYGPRYSLVSVDHEYFNPTRNEKYAVSGCPTVMSELTEAVLRDDVPEPSATRDNPIQQLGLEVSVQIMVYHWLLGFESKLYHSSEYSAVYLYISYVLGKSAVSSSLVPRDFSTRTGDCASSPREGLHLFNEGRLWLCLATFGVVEALQDHDSWNYHWRRVSNRARLRSQVVDPTLQSHGKGNETWDDEGDGVMSEEALWYDQRFGMTAGLRVAPEFLSHDQFLKLRGELVNSAALTRKENVSRLLENASKHFKTGRQALIKSAQVSGSCNWDALADEAKALARVTIRNCIAITQLLKIGSSTVHSNANGRRLPDISLCFDDHRHFPVVIISM